MPMDIHELLHHIRTDISDIRVSQARTEENLHEHMRRTQLAEENLDMLRTEMRTELKPVKDHVATMQTITRLLLKAGAATLGICGLVVAVVELFIK